MEQETREKIQKGFKYGGLTVTAVVSVLAVGTVVINNLFKPEFLNNLLKEGKGEMILNVVAGIGLLVLTALVAGLAISNHKNKPEMSQKEINNLKGENETLTTEKKRLVTAVQGEIASSPNAKLSEVLKIENNISSCDIIN